MNKDIISQLITRFFENEYPKDVIFKFRSWFTNSEDRVLKDEVLNELWKKETTTANTRTWQGLQLINHKVKAERKQAHVRLYKRMARIAAFFLLPTLGAVVAYLVVVPDKQKLIVDTQITEYFVPEGEMKQVLLPDGSKAWINAGTMLLYTEETRGKKRMLYLNGEATFEVVKNKEKPFVVKAQHLQIEALGTKFNVNTYSGSGISRVTVEEGLVWVDLDGETSRSAFLHSNEQFVYNHRLGEFSKVDVDAKLINKWTEGYLVFEDATFEDIMQTVERRFNVTIHYDIRKYGGGSFSIKYTPYENVEQILDILNTLNPGMKWSKDKNIITIL